MFSTEAKGLALLREARALPVPQVISFGKLEAFAFLMLEFIPTGATTASTWERFGSGLANLHRQTEDNFGLDHANFIGRLPQPNGRHTSFADFYYQERLWPQCQLALDKGYLNKKEGDVMEALGQKLPEIIPVEPPALVHGDLWNGNFVIDERGNAWIIDPAVAYSHRESDLAMTRLFGGFPAAFYKAYDEESPLEPNWRQRIPLFQLYYLLVHLNLFGRSYYPAVKEAMQLR